MSASTAARRRIAAPVDVLFSESLLHQTGVCVAAGRDAGTEDERREDAARLTVERA
jgi:hypothetical protein